MKSRANIKSHPIHPILIPFPIAFFIGTLVFDILGLVNQDPDFLKTGKYLEICGIITALLAAIPGIIDYAHTVPPNSSAKKRATKHGLINITTVIIFFAAVLLKNKDVSMTLILSLEVIGISLLSLAGWMGGTLVYRNQIGIDVRYANAGKWKELEISEDVGKIEIARAHELELNQMKLLHLKKKRIVLARTEEGYVAFDDHCTHRGGSLASGAMICGTVQCPWHGSQFDIKTGLAKAGPAKEKINTFQILVEDGKVYLIN
jgi:uncharacterized membrane protein/nitrite reductase/ring-hydroxylating ferredoxin subunit